MSSPEASQVTVPAKRSTDPDTARLITVSAVTLVDDRGRWLLVRKHGTSRFMHPGGKPEVGESPRQTATREVAEELGLRLDPEELEDLGEFTTATANEPGFVLRAAMFRAPLPAAPCALAEIAELRWVDPAEVAELDPDHCDPWAPLVVELARTMAARQAARVPAAAEAKE